MEKKRRKLEEEEESESESTTTTTETDTSDDDVEGVEVDDESSSDDSEIYRLGQSWVVQPYMNKVRIFIPVYLNEFVLTNKHSERPKRKKTTAEDFAGAMNRILSSRTKAADQNVSVSSILYMSSW